MLLAVKRVYVDALGDELFSRQLREKLIAALQASSHFEVVSNRDDADAVFRGSARPGIRTAAGAIVVLELVNTGGEVIWKLSTRQEGRILSSDAANVSAEIVKALLHEIKIQEQQRQP